jgi:hypothetical protein
MRDHCFLLAGWRADFQLATLRHLHTSLLASDVSYCMDVENEVLVVRDFFKVTVTCTYTCMNCKDWPNFWPKKFSISALAGHGKATTQTQADCFRQLDGKVDGLLTAE